MGPPQTYHRSMTDIQPSLPLTPAVFHILLALAKGDKHGYAIMKEVMQDSGGKIRMGNGTLYGSLKRMLSDELIQDAGDRTGDDETRRKYYKLTARGRKALNAEMKRYVDTAEVIKTSTMISHLLGAH
jgi:DNA-binding PadR family transcriptional regulator